VTWTTSAEGAIQYVAEAVIVNLTELQVRLARMSARDPAGMGRAAAYMWTRYANLGHPPR
jgi:hypothetical protein